MSGSRGFSRNSNRKTNISVKTDKSLKHNGVKDAFEKHVKLQVKKVQLFHLNINYLKQRPALSLPRGINSFKSACLEPANHFTKFNED